MKQTAKDAISALTFRNIFAAIAMAAVSVLAIDVVGYTIWKRFILPSLIILVAYFGRKIACLIDQDGLSRFVNAASVGMAMFGIFLYGAACMDALLFPIDGYISFGVSSMLWAWMAFHVYQALRILRQMPPARRKLVTNSTAVIIAQMTYREQETKEVLDHYDKEIKKLKLVA